ncbi:HNH endonuclease [Paeniglutamicibacter cryotolerans]|uniref:Plasmid stabilization system protein ParE n=1 Tax=Paeniglutamicibacter cryotolerans TaxID=670079 RepID=A0A839QDL4_9MICC|nr:DUF222 domain-containing protein [Paeniglutamicibacter cryotolerans]MBB2994288.1 plasmid stabilization system protein ParE [Paeniglutamicibacter cryotolerans]
MFEARNTTDSNPTDPPAPAPGTHLPATALLGHITTLTHTARTLIPVLQHTTATETDLVDIITGIEETKAALAALETHATLALDTATRATQARHGATPETLGRGVGTQIALARHEAPTEGLRHLRCSRILIEDLPLTLAHLTRGGFTEDQALTLAHEVRHLNPDLRTEIDTRLHAHPEDFTGQGAKALSNCVRTLAQELDPRDLLAQAETARQKRYVTLYPAPHAMMHLTGMLPVDQGLLIQAVLNDLTDSTLATGQGAGRNREQIRTDEFFELLTGTHTRAPAVEIGLIITDRSLFEGDTEPAYLQGYGSVPSPWARDLIRGDDHDAKAIRWIRRLYTAPGTGDLLNMDSTRRTYPRGLAKFIRVRDQICATPGCNHPIGHYDHIHQAALGGKTTAANGAGRCAWCNQTKETLGFTERVIPGIRHGFEITTPAGKTYRSIAPPLPGTHTRN